MTFLRAVAGLALGLTVLAGLLYLLVVANITKQLEDPQVYKTAINDAGAYDRIYDEILVDEALREGSNRLLGNVETATHEDAVRVLREIMPPAYLREQTEANIDRFTAYLRYESEDLELYVSLAEPLERVEPAALGEVHRFIEELEIAEPESSGCSLSSLQDLASAAAEPYGQLAQGRLPRSAPSLEILSRECREREFDRWFGLLVDDPVLDSPAARVLREEREELRRSFVEGDTRGFLKSAAGPLGEPVIDNAVAEVRRNLHHGDRFDLLEWAAGRSPDLDRWDIEAGAESLRQGLRAVNGPGRLIALATVVSGILLLALVHLPRPPAMLRWPGIALLAGGGVCLMVGFAVHSALPGLAGESLMSHSGNVPPSAMALAGDVLESFLRQATGGFVPAAAVVMALGAALIAASLGCGRLSALVGRILPTPEGSDGNEG